MRLRLVTQLLPGVAVPMTLLLALGFSLNEPTYAGSNKFFCVQEGNVPVTKVRTARGNETFIRWVVQDFKKFPPAQRCKDVSARFQRYYDNGSLFITSRDNFNNYPVLCIANRKSVPCTSENILVTLKPGTDTGAVLRQILDFRRGVAAKPINLSGCQAITYDEQGDLYLDVKQLVDGKKCSESTTSNNAPKTQPVQPRF
ncbi:hypothetical protein IQ259_26755 [Fortiea sp. LEGE XX443]|uniref:COP23 domain-containing protein n=1 Tax=Fortiea sp. LEGE XX443 TaxID=1828611 RepID=UPI001882973B|nr:COP23 domain-containing protein [Fortiea sp. LEGE XX443]MBE9008544.1 hypothetical protein [Fortiea sp. LEGE XX443]